MASDVVFSIGANTKNAATAIARLSKSSLGVFGKIGGAATGLNQGLELVGKAFRLVGSALDSTITPALEFGDSLAEIQTLLKDGEVSTKSLGKTVLSLQKQFGGSSKGISTAYYNAISSGAVSAAKAQGFLEDANKLAIGGVTDINTAVGGLTTVISAFGKTADDHQYAASRPSPRY